MNYAGLVVEASLLKDIALAVITEFLKKGTDYLFNIGKVNESLDDDSKIIPTSVVSSVDNDLVAIIWTTELEITADELEDQDLLQYLEDFLASSSKELGWTMEKYFEEIEYDLSIKNPTSRVLDLLEAMDNHCYQVRSLRNAGGPLRQEAMTRADYQEA